MKLGRFISQESDDPGLRINQINKPGQDEFDELHAEVQNKLDAAKAENESGLDSGVDQGGDGESENDLPPVDGDADAEKGDGSDTELPAEAESEDPPEEVSVESWLEIHSEALNIHIGTEDEFTKSNLLTTVGTAAAAAGGATLGFLKTIGFEYGPVLLKHVFKGVLFALSKTLKAIAYGVNAISSYMKKRSESYENFKKKIDSARETLALAISDKATVSKDENGNGPGEKFTDLKTISALKVGDKLDFVSNIEEVVKFNEGFFNEFGKGTVGSIISVRYILRSVMNSNTKLPSTKLTGKINFSGFGELTLPGYEPSSDLTVSCGFQTTLAGDIRFMGFVPRDGLSSYEDICKAFQNSKMFMGFTDDVNNPVQECEYASADEMEKILDLLESICDKGLQAQKTYNTIIEARKSLNNDFRLYIKHLLTAKDKISIRDSFSQLISTKIEFTDRTFIQGSFKVHDYNVQVLTAALDYVKASIKTLV